MQDKMMQVAVQQKRAWCCHGSAAEQELKVSCYCKDKKKANAIEGCKKTGLQAV